MNPVLVSQRTWAKELGISVWTFRRWVAVGRIPQPLALPGWPRWSRKVVDRVNAEIARSGEGRYFRTAYTRSTQRGFQSASSRFQQGQRPQDGAVVTGEGGLNVHAATVSGRERAEKINSVEGAR